MAPKKEDKDKKDDKKKKDDKRDSKRGSKSEGIQYNRFPSKD